jgi:hypothetical protein
MSCGWIEAGVGVVCWDLKLERVLLGVVEMVGREVDVVLLCVEIWHCVGIDWWVCDEQKAVC